MKKVEFVPFRLTDVVDIFTIRIDDNEKTEIEEFLITFRETDKVHIRHDFEQILKTLAEIVHQGVKESFFRPEGNVNDRVCAIPLFSSRYNNKGTLRLYCIRHSEELLIIGGGGLKTTRTYQEDEILYKHVQTMQNIDKELSRLEDYGKNIHREIYNLTINID